jgi:adenine-specific DNA-methyltransferase|tara:strand:+ start:686 stop:1696 length:1011 start_codon:yes stop_codon:yes gene_type:complete
MFTKKLPKINFIGNKEKISTWICNQFPKNVKSVFDAFSGGGSVGFEAKRKGLRVISNDVLHVNYLLAKALIENNKKTITDRDLKIIFAGNPFKGFMYKNFSKVHFFPQECMQLDLYRKNINKLSCKYKKALALSLLRRAMIRKMPYSRFNILWKKVVQLRDEDFSYKYYKRKRAYHNQSFKHHFVENLENYNKAIFNNKKINIALNLDIYKAINKVNTDIIYLDPPYTGTMNDYYGFYGLIDNYISSKKIKRFKNDFIDKKKALSNFDRLFSKLKKFKYWYLSYNNQSYPTSRQIYKLLRKYSDNVKLIKKRHVYKITGKSKKQANTEYLFIVKNK